MPPRRVGTDEYYEGDYEEDAPYGAYGTYASSSQHKSPSPHKRETKGLTAQPVSFSYSDRLNSQRLSGFSESPRR